MSKFELQTAALQDHPAAILPTRRKAQLRIKRLCHIEIARWQIGVTWSAMAQRSLSAMRAV